ncbi:MAG: hypothetical protein Q9181_003935 [Wetmoreana brouardii]
MPGSRWKDNDRFKKEYGLPPSRPDIAPKDLEGDKYTTIRRLVAEGIGGLNEGINLVKDNKSGRRVVQKQIDPSKNVLLRELLLLQALDHPNVIKYVDAFIDRSAWHHHTASLYMQFCNLSSAQRLLEKYHRHNAGRDDDDHVYIPEAFIWHIFRSLASALQYLHFGIKPGDKRDPEELNTLVRADGYPQIWPMILHRDIKPENVFFRKEQPRWGRTVQRRKFLRIIPISRKTYRIYPQHPRVVLGDFGLALQHNDDDWNEERDFVGTYRWMPPELPKTYCQGDIWAVGAVILALCRQMPDGVVKPAPADWTEGEDAWSRHRDARKGIRDHGVGKHYSPELNYVVYECLRFNRANRPLAFKLLAMINEGEKAAGKKGFLDNDVFPKWIWGGAEDRLRRKKPDAADKPKK